MAELLNTKTLDTMSLSTQVASAADISTFVNTTASDTLGGAKTYTDAEISALSADFNARIAALEGFTSFIGVKDSLPETAEDGQICIVGNKEYIYGSKVDGSVGWTELGDTTAETAAIDELSNAVANLTVNKADVSSVNASVEALTKAIDDVEASLSGYDTLGSAAAAQEAAVTAAKAYTDEQITAVEGEISLLGSILETKASDELVIDLQENKADKETVMSLEETKADKATVDAAISEINDSISALSAKAEEDPIFTAWKDGTSIALGNGANAVSSTEVDSTIAIGTNSSATAYGAVAIGDDTTASGYSGVAIGQNSRSLEEKTVSIGETATAEKNGAVAIGGESKASGMYSVAIGRQSIVNNDGGIAIGNMTESSAFGAIALGEIAKALAQDSVQIGLGENSVENSLQFRSTQIVNGDGKITTANLAGMDTLKTALNNVAEVTASDDVAKLRATVNALAAAIKAFAGLL